MEGHPPGRPMEMPSDLTPAERALYRIIADAVMGEEMTPTTIMLRAALAQAGHKVSRDHIGEALRRLSDAGLIQRGRVGALRVYRLPDSDRQTEPHKTPQAENCQRRESAMARPEAAVLLDWPRPTAESIAAYDAAMARRPYASIRKSARISSEAGRRDRFDPITIRSAAMEKK